MGERELTLEEIRYYKRNNQIAFLNQEAIDKALVYRDCYEVGEQNG